MQLYKIRGGNIEELNQKKYTIGVGISLGNKWFTLENIIELVEWSLLHTKNKVIVYIADSIHAINLEIRKKISPEKASKLADEMGREVLNKVKSEVKRRFSQEKVEKIVYVRWQDLVDESYRNKLDYLRFFYKKDDEFRNTIHSIIRNFVSKENREFSNDEINRLGEYVIEEMPEVINRVNMAGIICDAYTYPFDGDLARLVEKIQKGEIFPEIKENIMDTEPKVFLEVR